MRARTALKQRKGTLTKVISTTLLAYCLLSLSTDGQHSTLTRWLATATETEPAAMADADESDPAEVAIGERLFLETRFAQFFFANSNGHANAVVPNGDPTLDFTVTTTGVLPGPFAGTSMNCRSCHLVDEQSATAGGGMRTYGDFARRSPIPARADGKTLTPRNSPPLVNASLRRGNFLLHFDGEFATPEDLVRATLTGRNYGWLPREGAQALRHVAHIIRNDDGTGELAQAFGGAYRVVFKGTDLSIPAELRLPRRYRLDVLRASDEEILNAIARLVSVYLRQLIFAQNERGVFNGSPYDAFLRKNNLPAMPRQGESDLEYSRRLRKLLDGLPQPRFVTEADGHFEFHNQSFVFGPTELAGLKTFLREPKRLPLTEVELTTGSIGNCIACHAAPNFTDFSLHNTGAAQDEYDSIHGAGAFAALYIPDLLTRRLNFNAYLPPTADHPNALGPYLDIPSAGNPGRTDLGAWNVFANPDHPRPQARIRNLLCADEHQRNCSNHELLLKAIASFKTPGLRDLSHAAPYLHTGRADDLTAVIALYGKFSALARAGTMRNPAPALKGIALQASDAQALVAFLRALNEDYN